MANPKSYKSWLLSPIHRADRQVSIYMQAHLKDLGVSAADGHLLSYVSRYGPCAVGELLRVLGIRRTTMTSMLDRLEERDFVLRRVNPSDRRSFLVEITDTGWQIVARSGEILEAFERRVRKRVSREATTGMQEVLAAIDDVTRVKVRGPSNPPDRNTGRQPY